MYNLGVISRHTVLDRIRVSIYRYHYMAQTMVKSKHTFNKKGFEPRYISAKIADQVDKVANYFKFQKNSKNS